MSQPLAERMRPTTLADYIGQKHLVGPGAVLHKMVEQRRVSSMILWGPPGVGKTTLAQIIAHQVEVPFYTLSAVTSGVKDVREVIDKAKNNRFFSTESPILFILLFNTILSTLLLHCFSIVTMDNRWTIDGQSMDNKRRMNKGRTKDERSKNGEIAKDERWISDSAVKSFCSCSSRSVCCKNIHEFAVCLHFYHHKEPPLMLLRQIW